MKNPDPEIYKAVRCSSCRKEFFLLKRFHPGSHYLCADCTVTERKPLAEREMDIDKSHSFRNRLIMFLVMVLIIATLLFAKGVIHL